MKTIQILILLSLIILNSIRSKQFLGRPGPYSGGYIGPGPYGPVGVPGAYGGIGGVGPSVYGQGPYGGGLGGGLIGGLIGLAASGNRNNQIRNQPNYAQPNNQQGQGYFDQNRNLIPPSNSTNNTNSTGQSGNFTAPSNITNITNSTS